MVSEQDSAIDTQNLVSFKLKELRIDSEDPWSDDLFRRENIAARLTPLISPQGQQLTISLHGQWGAGKTFMLKRWRKALGNAGYHAIYFNAWEDDFSNDPLLAITGQLSEHFKRGVLKNLAVKVAQYAVPLIVENLLGVAKASLGVSLKTEEKDKTIHPLLDAYLEQKATKDRLRTQLTKLSEHIGKRTKHPLVIIVDELDRCRPTFAIELLERVKHIFDVPNMVFVFGLNRDELCESLVSVYGNINTDVYLRRFFDFEFNLPDVDSRVFARYLIQRYRIGDALQQLANATGDQNIIKDYENYLLVIPSLWATMGLLPRDIDYGVRLLAFLAVNVSAGTFTHPFLLAVFIAIKFTKPDLYHELIKGNFQASEIMDYIDSTARRDLVTPDLTHQLDRIEGFLYCADGVNRHGEMNGMKAFTELRGLSPEDGELNFQVISQRAQNASEQQKERIRWAIQDGNMLPITNKVFGDLAKLIDIHQEALRR